MKEKTNSESNVGVLSQIELMNRVLPLLKSEGKIYEKTMTVYARVAEGGEQIDTITSDGLETTNTAEKGDYIVKNKTEAGESYILRPDTFNKTYKLLKENEDDFNEYRADKQIIAVELSDSFFIENKVKELYFVAPWGAKMVVKENDFLVCPLNYSEIYRIARKEFFETYQLSTDENSTIKPLTTPSTNETVMPDQSVKPLRFFVSYSHKDESYKDNLVEFFAPLRRSGAIASWDDRQIPLGGEWDHIIKDEMNKADVILLLISSSFLSSSYCNDVEVTRAMDRHHDKSDAAVVIPIILRPCDWTDAPFAKLQALPKNALPITKYEYRDEAYLFIVKQIKNLIKQRSQPKSTSNAPNQTTPQSTPTATETATVVNTPSSTPQAPTLDRDMVRNLIAQNKVEEALKIMMEVAKEKDSTTHNILIQKSAEFTGIKRDSLMGVIPNSDLARMKAKLNYDMLQLLNSL